MKLRLMNDLSDSGLSVNMHTAARTGCRIFRIRENAAQPIAFGNNSIIG